MNTQAKSWARILLVMVVVAMLICSTGASVALRADNSSDVGTHHYYLAKRNIDGGDLAIHLHR